MTFTTKEETESATATLESANLAAEQAEFLRIENARRVYATLFDKTNGSSPGHAARLNGSTNEKYGLAKSLSVMPGDTIKMEVFAKYVDGNQTNWTQALTDLITAVNANTAGVVVDGSGYSVSTLSFNYGGLLNTSGSSGNGPKAYLNWLMFDRDYNFLNGGYQRMSDVAKENGQDVAHEKLSTSILATEPGYVYIYLSNEETTPVEVFFDDFKVEQVKSPIVSTSDYYAYGLQFENHGRENSTIQSFLYNSKELQEELDLGLYDFQRRQYDPAIGRFTTVDPATDLMRRHSPYNFAFDNPMRFTDPDGMTPVDEVKEIKGGGGIEVERKKFDKKDRELKALSFRKAARIETNITIKNPKVLNKTEGNGARQASDAEVKEAGETMLKEISDTWSGTSTDKRGITTTVDVKVEGEVEVIHNEGEVSKSEFLMNITEDDSYVLGSVSHLGSNHINVGLSNSYLIDVMNENDISKYDKTTRSPMTLNLFGVGSQKGDRVASHEFGHTGGLPDRQNGGMMSIRMGRVLPNERYNFFRGR